VGLLTVAVRHVASATPRTRIIGLDLGATPFPFAAGQAVMVGLHGSPLRKPYSIASAPWEFLKTGVLHVLAQVDETGALDPHLELAAPGTLIDLDGPFGSFGQRRRDGHRAAAVDPDGAAVATAGSGRCRGV
jgi:NAD(P)H-flavin reductase